MKVLITGAAGFLGQSIAQRYLSAGWKAVGIGRSNPSGPWLHSDARYLKWSLPDPRVDEVLGSALPDVCVHTAGRASVPMSLTDPATDYANGPRLVFDLLDSIRRVSPQTRFLCLSSAAVYGEPKRLPIGESDPLRPISPYGFHKWQSELVCREFSSVYGLRTASLRIFSAYGAGLARQVFWDICEKLNASPHVRLPGTGRESRDFIHAQDVAQAVECIAERAPMHGESYNVATGRETVIADLAQRLTQSLCPGATISFVESSLPGMPLHWRADIGQLAALGFTPSLSIEEGVEEYVAWYQQEARPRQRAASA